MTTPKEHKPGCGIDPVHWLRHAIAATNLRIGEGDADDRPHADRLSSASLLNALEHFSEQDGWRTVTLFEVATFASLMDVNMSSLCTCDQLPDEDGPTRHSRIW